MNNMTGDPNQETHPSVFGFEPYPSFNVQPIDWTRIPTPTFTPLQYPQGGLGNFAFSTSQTPHPAHFPLSAASGGCASTSNGSFSNVRCKRKTEAPSFQASKQHITEEKMAEHMSRLHISSETATSSKESDRERTQRLYMCEEMRKLQSDTILPQALLSRIQRPCTALVLWTPPRRLIPPDLDENNGNNNDEQVPDHNRMALDMDLDNV